MNYAAIVLFNNKNPLSSVEYPAVTDALLQGGVFLGGVEILPYDAPEHILGALARLSAENDGVFLICDRVLISSAKQAVERAADVKFSEDVLLETERCLYGVLPSGKEGAAVVPAVVARIDARRKQSYARVVMCAVHAPAEKLYAALSAAGAVGGGAFSLHVTEKFGVQRIELIYDRTTPKMAVDEATRILADALFDYIYVAGDESPAERLFNLLRVRRLRLSTAESFTGGGIGRAIVQFAGASEVFYEGLNVYHENAKAERLGVREETLKRGVVSGDTAYEMAAGLLRTGHCDLAVATTGYASPLKDGTPAGLCYIAVGTREEVRVYCYHLSGDRETVTETAVNIALFLAYQAAK